MLLEVPAQARAYRMDGVLMRIGEVPILRAPKRKGRLMRPLSLRREESEQLEVPAHAHTHRVEAFSKLLSPLETWPWS